MLAELTVNGESRSVELDGGESLLTVLREQLGCKSVKGACEEGECGSCSVLVDGESVCACLMLAADAQDSEILTTEGLTPATGLNPLQESFLRHCAVQCGFCTPGLVVASTALLAHNPKPSREVIREELAGNLCRCTGYQSIVEAVHAASRAGAANL